MMYAAKLDRHPGLDPGSIARPARPDGCRLGAAATVERLVALLHEHKALCIAGQRLTPDQFVAFGRGFGEPMPRRHTS